MAQVQARQQAVKLDWRSLAAFLHDLAACAVAWLLAFWLRFNLESIPPPFDHAAVQSLAWILPLYGALFIGFRLYRGLWRFASLPDLRRIVISVAVGAIAAPALLFMVQIIVPRSVLIMSPVFLVMAMGASRLAYRAWKERTLGALVPSVREPVFVIGAGNAAVNLIRELGGSPQWHVVGVFAGDNAVLGRQLHGVNVVGHFDDLARWKHKLGARQAILAMPEATHELRRRVVERCDAVGVKVLTVPSFDDLMSGRVTISQVRNVELDDLLGRDPVVLDTASLRNWLKDRVVLVSGAGGSIGAELCRQIARFEPRLLILLELNEFALYSIEQEFTERFRDVAVITAIGDVKSEARVAQLMEAYRPSILFHAAAYKHVPLMEAENAWQAIINNVAGTAVMARAAQKYGVEKFVLISTDKAVNPANVMGASKRMAEMVCLALLQPGGATRFVMVRFGNVLGSTGSVIPKFREQIAHGGPVTVTHPDITRYFMSLTEAVQLVMQAGLMGQGGEIFVLDMGQPVRIADLARDMIRLSGLTEQDVPIVYTGLRPGEKLYEEPLAANENSLATPHPKLRIARAQPKNGEWLAEVSRWLAMNRFPSDAEVKAQLARWVPEYSGR